MQQNNRKYKQTSIGLIPTDWKVKRFAEVFYVFPTASYSRADLTDSDETLYMHYGDIHTKYHFHIDVNSAQLPTIPVDKVKNYEFVKEGDLIISDASEDYEGVGKAIEVVNLGENKMIAGLHTFHLREKTQVFARLFKGYVSLHKDVVKQYRKMATGTKVYSISKDSLLKIQIPLPPLPEQQKIAEILSTWDKAIQEVQLLIKKLEVRNKALAFSLLTGKKRVKGFEGKEFKKSFANQVFKSVSVKNNTENVELLSATQENGIIPRSLLETRVTMPSGSLNTYKLVQKGDFVISLRSFQGGIEYSEYTGVVSPAYTVLKPINPINDNFYKYYFKSRDLIGRLSVAVIGIRDGKNISYDDFSTIILPNPSLEEQTAIAEILNTAQQELKQYQEKLKALQQQKKGLMQQLLTGKIRTV